MKEMLKARAETVVPRLAAGGYNDAGQGEEAEEEGQGQQGAAEGGA